MVTNTSVNTQTANVFLSFNGQQHASPAIAFNPHETKILSITSLLAAMNVSPAQAPQGSITIIQQGANPALIAQGRVTDPVTGFSSTLEFPNPARQPLSALHASGVPIGTPTADSPFAGDGDFIPHVIASNISSAPQMVAVTIEYPVAAQPGANAILAPVGKKEFDGESGASVGQMTVASFPVAAYSTEDFSLAAIMSELPLPLPYCSIRIQYSGPPGSLIAQVPSVDAQQDLVIDAHTMNEGDGWAGSGANPWHLDSRTESILFLTDESGKPARIGFHVVANGVTYRLTQLKLNPHETRAIDIRKLRDAQNTDFLKNQIPAGVTDGSVEWVRIDNVAVAGRVVVIQKNQGTASGYDCCMCPCAESFRSVAMSPVSCNIIPGGNMLLTATSTCQACNGPKDYYDVSEEATWTSSDTSVAAFNPNDLGEIDGVVGGTSTLQVKYCDYTYSGTSCTANWVCHTGSGTAFVFGLTSGTSAGQQNSVTRAGTVVCSINGFPAGAAVSNWKFTDGTNSVTSTSTAYSWSGTAVQSGTTSVTVTNAGSPANLSAQLSVTARTGFAFTSVSPVKVGNGAGTGRCTGLLSVLTTPTGLSSLTGQSCLSQSYSYVPSQVSGGPNSSYWYVSSASNTNGSANTIYQWERVPDLDNTSSTFYTKQTGTYNAQTDPTGCISGSNLAAQTQRHEIGSVEGHWGNYNNAQNNSSNNLGDVAEAQVGAPSLTQTQFQNNATGALNSAAQTIKQAESVEPYPVNYDQNDVFLGYVNFASAYTSCH